MNTSEGIAVQEKKVWKIRKLTLGVFAFLIVASIGGKALYRYKFPYGQSHACSKGLGIALRMYAKDHDGWLPYGQETPEASLALLAEDDFVSALWVLGGKIVPRKVLQSALTNRGLFGPHTCGWHYVEGLREDDDPEIIVAWDKPEGLDHHGMRRSGLMHEVVFLDGSNRFISKDKWPGFVADQKARLAKAMVSRQSDAPPIRWSDEATLGPNQFPAPTR